MEQVLGHVTWYENLRRAVTELDGLDARWVETTLFDESGLLERVPGLPSSMRAGGRALLDVRRALRGRPCDVLFFNTQKPAIFCQSQMLRTPTILMTDVTPRQYDRMAALYDHAVDHNPLVRATKHLANVLNFRLARAIVPWSTWVRDSLLGEYGVPAERIHVIPPGVDTERWRPAERRRETERVRLLFVGGNFERKGGRLLLDVFRGLGLQDRAELHIVTRDPVEPSSGVVVHRHMQNNSAELLALYQQADLFILPTQADCFSIASIEAMAAGLPVITTAMGGIPDIVAHGQTGYLIPPGDRRALSETVQLLIPDRQRRTEFGAAGRQRAVAQFDARVNAARILDLACALHERKKRVADSQTK